MKLLVIGAGAVGGLVAARFVQAKHAVELVARGPQLHAIRERGITIHAPSGTDVTRVPVVEQPVVDDQTHVLVAVKTQDVAAALRALALVAPPSTPVACITNGLQAERMVLRWFDRSYAICANVPASYLDPGVIEAWGTPITGVFDVGRYPEGTDDTCTALSGAFESAGFSSRVVADIMRWKRGKLVFNLSNALEALCGPAGRTHPIVKELRAEAHAVYAAAQLATTTDEEARERTSHAGTIPGRTRGGGSTWQSLARGSTLESEYLNGEIAQLGRVHGVPTPLNVALLREVTRAAAAGTPAGSQAIEAVVAHLTS